MKKLELLNKNYLSIILIFFLFGYSSNSQEPVDIWNLEKKKTDEIKKNNGKNNTQNSIYEMQSQKKTLLSIEEDEALTSKEIEISGLYDPEENGLDINMWSNSDGKSIIKLFKDINNLNLSKDASEILDIVVLTNSYYPKINISKDQFLEIKSNWLIKNSNFKLIEDYLIRNQTIKGHVGLTTYWVNEYLSKSEIKKACKIFSKILDPIDDEYLIKFNIYCLINNNENEKAQLLLDLKKELGFKDKFFEKKVEYLLGYNDKPDLLVSEKTILDFHLSHRTNPEFNFEPTSSTSKQIWKYLSTSNLLGNIIDIELTDFNKIKTVEKATHEKNYTEKELFELYKRFQFNINQLLNIKESSKLMKNVEARALIYQGILITSDIEKKLELMNALKNSFNNDGIGNAFSKELVIFLKEINEEEIPSNYTAFYKRYINKEKVELNNIKVNNKILHQSKLINYFKEEIPLKNITKDLNDFLKKIKKDKKYFFSKKDIILVETLKSDGVKVSEKYNNLYKIEESEMPSDIQAFIDNGEMGAAMLRLVEVIGQDELKDIDPDTLYFIINTLNQLDVDPLRNQILLKVLPLKV